MKYYKIIENSTFIGIVTSGDFRTYNEGSNRLLASDETTGQFIRYDNKLYRDYWMQLLPSKEYDYIQADIIEISQQEFEEIAQIDIEDEIAIKPYIPTPDEPLEPVETVDPMEEITIEYIRKKKLNTLSTTCRTIIEQGFDLELRGMTRHFSLTTQDQLNLMNLSVTAQNQSLIPYHADGEECVFYTAEEMNAIVAAATAFKIYHTTYYNALKTYINALDTIEAIGAITYGTPIPDEYKSDVLKILE